MAVRVNLVFDRVNIGNARFVPPKPLQPCRH